MTRTRTLLIAGTLLLLLSGTSNASGGYGGEAGEGGIGKRPKLPRPLGAPPARAPSVLVPSAPSANARPGVQGPGPRGDGVIDVIDPAVVALSPAELAAMRSRAGAQPRPDGTVKASPELEPRHGQTPIGYDPDKARALAPGIAALLASKGPKGYPRDRLAAWQTLAGVRSDGGYGGSTRGALVFYGVSKPPRPFVAPFATLPYHPPDLQP